MSSAVRTVVWGDVEQSGPLPEIRVQTFSYEVQSQPQTMAENYLKSPTQAQDRLNHFEQDLSLFFNSRYS